MTDRYRVITVVIGVLAATVAVQADMMSAVCAEPTQDRPDPIVDSINSLSLHGPALPFAVATGFSAADDVAETDAEQGQAAEVPRLQDSANKLDSFDLCLYALVGLGLCRTGHLVKRPSLGFVPEWYHSGAPQQIGHSLAVGPDAFCLATICFVQPDSEVGPDIPQHRRGHITSLWRCSQFTPSVLASRAPPG
ncbi:MAG: hypothetical protein JSW27_04050 [Phycisphaerales bacterium]|nr:MAG: hypothetical protein JSW27_04050 [Phycisphaerales bacterium]